ncbi:hypothetical protein R1flu_025117 [Riccia fluitans]|uniref:RING-type domain-containing protein n=1 Tax=Riccia fluitans TaxID=41844 RepID=A0ABD1XWU7_9MARC
MEGGGGEHRKKLRSFGSRGDSAGEEADHKKSPRGDHKSSGEDLACKRFDLKHEATRQDEIVDYLRRKDCSLDGLRQLGEKTLRLLSELYRITETRGERMVEQIPSLSSPYLEAMSAPYLEVISAVKKTVEGLIDDVKDVKNTVLSQRKATSTRPQTRAQTRAGNGVFLTSKSLNFEESQDREKVHVEEVVHHQNHLSKPQVAETQPQLRRKRTRIMCQNCLDKPRNSVILRCKHSLHCPKCLAAGKECISNCTGCGKDISNFVIDSGAKVL